MLKNCVPTLKSIVWCSKHITLNTRQELRGIPSWPGVFMLQGYGLEYC